MMKRMRTVGEAPKFRRGAKGRTSSRLGYGESVYMSLNNLVYLKLAMVWLGCIVLDFVVGFRFELLWPVWLLIRHLYEPLRTQAFASSLHYSAFSVFFVCVTASCDLVCYLFIPLQVLVFIASTYVWVQFVYSSTESVRGICLPSLVLWTLFVVFEYCVRYRFDNATTWYLARSSWLTAGLLPSTAESIVVGGSGTAATAGSAFSFAPRLELCRPFAAHSVGFPLVTLGFRVKSLYSGWRMRIRRKEVRRQNEYLEKVLAEAVPQTSDERRYHFISSAHHTTTASVAALEQQEGMDAADSSPYAEICSASLTPLHPTAGIRAMDERGGGGGALQATLLGATTTPASSSVGMNGWAASSSNSSQLVAASKRNHLPSHHKSSGAASGGLTQSSSSSLVQRRAAGGQRVTTASCWRSINSQAHIAASPTQNSNHDHTTSPSSGRKREAVKRLIAYPSRNEPLVIKLWRYILVSIPKLVITALLSAIGGHLLNNASGAANGTSQDDSLSISGDGSNAAEEESDQEECSGGRTTWAHQQQHPQQQSVGKKKGKKMAKYLASMTKCSSATNLDTVTNGNVNGHSDHSPTAYASCNGKEGEMDPSTWSTIRTVEMQQLQRAKSEFELMADKLRADLKMQRILESELRSQLTQLQNDCHSHRGEASQSKSKVEQLEGKCKNLAKQNETMRANFASLEKRAGEVQARKAELERELASERSNNAKQVKEDMWSSKSNEFSDPTALIQSLKSKSASLEREMKGLRRELRSKEDQVSTLEEDLRLFRSLSRVNNDNEWKKQLEELEQKNYLLEQTLSSENRLKQDLFRALNDSKAQIEMLKARLDKLSNMKENGAGHEFGSESPFGAIAPPPPPPPAYSTLIGEDKSSVTPPPISVAPSLNLDQLMQITGAGKHMSYSFAPPDNGDDICDGYKTPVGDSLPGLAISDLTVGSQRHASSQQAASHHQQR